MTPQEETEQTQEPQGAPSEGTPAATGLSSGSLLSLAVVVLLVTAGLVYWFGFARDSSESGVITIGKRPPDFSLPGLHGETIKLSDYRGQVVLVNFWATWCPPCRVEMPEFESVYQDYRDQNFEIIGIDQGEPLDLVRSYLEENPYSWVFALDESGEASTKYGVYGLPQSFLLDEEGRVAYIWHGLVTRDSLERQLNKLGLES